MGVLILLIAGCQEGLMLDADFYRKALPERITMECKRDTNAIPVVLLHLSTGRTLDVCHISHVADTWAAVLCYRDTSTCKDMDLACLPYELVTYVTVSIYNRSERPMGFGAELHAA